MNSKSLVSIDDISRDEILQLLESRATSKRIPTDVCLKARLWPHCFRTIHTYTTEL